MLNTQISNVIVAKLVKDSDLLKSIEKTAAENNVTSAMLYLIGAVSKATFGFFVNGEYKTIIMEKNFEILSCLGNISKKDDDIIVHAHVTFGDSEGKAFGGHLLEGSIIDPVGELFIYQLKDELKRKYHPDFKLSLLDL
ncbi:MAG: PPC domain-containing DNA-binding protein [Candidatus Helarchaeota archaeon]